MRGEAGAGRQKEPRSGNVLQPNPSNKDSARHTEGRSSSWASPVKSGASAAHAAATFCFAFSSFRSSSSRFLAAFSRSCLAASFAVARSWHWRHRGKEK